MLPAVGYRQGWRWLMIVGFYAGQALRDEEFENLLRKHAVERIFPGDIESLQSTLQNVIDYLRQGDVLVVPELSHLGRTIEQICANVDALHVLGIKLYILEPAITPGPLGDSFELACSYLVQICRQIQDQVASRIQHHSGKGRPPVLSKDKRERAKRLLDERGLSVSETARILGVSAATVYRYFPRTSSGRNPNDNGQQ